MPPTDKHVQIARENGHFLVGLNPANGPARGWGATVAFYEAIHWVEAFFAKQQIHSVDHRTRDSGLAMFAETKGIYNDFSELKTFSMNARYHGKYPTPEDYKLIVLPALESVQRQMSKAISPHP